MDKIYNLDSFINFLMNENDSFAMENFIKSNVSENVLEYFEESYIEYIKQIDHLEYPDYIQFLSKYSNSLSADDYNLLVLGGYAYKEVFLDIAEYYGVADEFEEHVQIINDNQKVELFIALGVDIIIGDGISNETVENIKYGNITD